MQIQDLEGTMAEEGEDKAKHHVTWSLGCPGAELRSPYHSWLRRSHRRSHPSITFPDQTDAHSVLTLEAELVTHLVELGVSG